MKEEKTSLITLQKEIKKLLEKGVLEGVFPAAAAGISWREGSKKKEIITSTGNAKIYPEKRILKINDFFDLASLTKPLAATLAILCLVKEKKIDIADRLSDVFEKKLRDDISNIRIRNLLSHSSGLPAYRDYYKILKNKESKEKNECLENLILQESLAYETGTISLYSDLGFMLLGRIIEKKAGCTLDEYVEKKILKPLHLEKKIFYNSLYEAKRNLPENKFVATENCSWRKKVLCGEVHDDNCYTMGGVAGHSGLFGNIEGVTGYTAAILEIWKGCYNHPNLKKEDLEFFLTRQKEIPESTWTLGFDTPSPQNSSSGHYLSKKSVGHLGFTGTSFWIDPEKDLVIVLLTNRVHPSRKNSKIKEFRPYFHDKIVENLFSQDK